jgi:hypothetical protein
MKREQDRKSQSDNFIEVARALGCDEDPAHFDAALKKVARHKPASDAPAPTKPQRQKKPSQ